MQPICAPDQDGQGQAFKVTDNIERRREGVMIDCHCGHASLQYRTYLKLENRLAPEAGVTSGDEIDDFRPVNHVLSINSPVLVRFEIMCC